MSLQKVKDYLKAFGKDKEIIEFSQSSATVELAAKAVGCTKGHIAKTLSFNLNDGVILIVCAGDVKIDNSKFKLEFGKKANMLKSEEVETRIGHAIGGVCPFGINEGVCVYLDKSLKEFDIVYPACGSSNSAIKLNLKELEMLSNYRKWVDVCKKCE